MIAIAIQLLLTVNIYCADVYDSSIKGKFGSASNGSIDIDESSGSGDSTTTSDNNSIIFEIWVRGTSNAAKINIKVQTPDGGVSNGVRYYSRSRSLS